jgi:D-glycero-alpha-D-manno-heptose 1-phosphate guanylyltransferase
MQAILLAGGFGTRLKSVIGESIPKPMVLVGGEPFLASFIRSLVKNGITEIMLAVHHQAHMIQDYFQDCFEGIPIRYSVEETALGTGGAMKQALSLLTPTAPIFVSNTDSFMNIDISTMMRTHLAANTSLTVAITEKSDCSNSGKVCINKDGRITSFLYPSSNDAGYISIGAYIISATIFDNYRLPAQFSFETDFKMHHIKHLNAQAHIHHGHFLDFGTETTFKQLSEYKTYSALID